MTALPHMPMYWADFLADTAHLTAIERSAYVLLIGNYWQRGEALSNAGERLRRVCMLTEAEWAEARPALVEFFDIDGDVWRHKRIEHELERAREKSEQARANRGGTGAGGKAKSAPPQQQSDGGSTDDQRAFDARATDVQRTCDGGSTAVRPPFDSQSRVDKNRNNNLVHPSESSAARVPADAGGAEAPRRTRFSKCFDDRDGTGPPPAGRRGRRVTVETVAANARRIGLADVVVDDVVAEVAAKGPDVRTPGPYLARTLLDHVGRWLATNGLDGIVSRADMLAAIEGDEPARDRIAGAFGRSGLAMGQVDLREARP